VVYLTKNGTIANVCQPTTHSIMLM